MTFDFFVDALALGVETSGTECPLWTLGSYEL